MNSDGNLYQASNAEVEGQNSAQDGLLWVTEGQSYGITLSSGKIKKENCLMYVLKDL
jgi:hypothetical protein